MRIVKKNKQIKNELTQLLTFQNILGLILTLFVVLDMKPSMNIASIFSSSMGYFILFILFIVLSTNVHPVILFIYVIFCYELINRSLIVTQRKYMKFLPGESTRTNYMKQTNFFPETLEENVIREQVKQIQYNEPNEYEFKDNDPTTIKYSKI